MPKKPFDYELIRQLATILDETDLTEIEVEQEDLRIRVARQPAPIAHYAPAQHAAMHAGPLVAATTAGVVTEAAATNDPASHPGVVTSPMVGTCYRAGEPGARSYVEVGDEVRQGQTVLIVEAMKHMNQIAAPRAGKVTAVFVENGQPVEYGEPLLIIE
ncbi:MAG TPA: acetyl-CoA carboxylase biotin carboxyl carrier protein [Methylomirabilota bacterium]|nr:acetyl-CoA carboxylase biotin carboxyl carrier protein [Methylomirabilota bacterium]